MSDRAAVEHQLTIKAIAEADRRHLAAAKAERELDDLLETKGVMAAVEKGGLSETPATLKWVAPLFDEIVRLKARVKELEARPPMVYKEVWSAAVKYSPGDVVTDHGAMWYAKAESQGRRPGGDASATYWRMCVRKGSDGKNCPNCATRTGENT